MDKRTFFQTLWDGLRGLSQEEKRNIVDHYAKLIALEMRRGKTEKEAVAEMGAPEHIIEKLLYEHDGNKPQELHMMDPVEILLSKLENLTKKKTHRGVKTR
jgi:uncharacterized membrane protein